MAHLRISRARLRDTLVQHFPSDQITFGATCVGVHLGSEEQGPIQVKFQVCQTLEEVSSWQNPVIIQS